MTLPHTGRIPGSATDFDAEVEAKAYDEAFYDASRKDFVSALPVLRQWFLDSFPLAKSAVDLGCGSGEMIACVKDVYDTYGVDFSVGAQAQAPTHLGDKFIIGDLTRPLRSQDKRLKRKFDIVFSVETYEHIPPQFEQAYLDNLGAFDCDYLVVSCALPAQKGRHHYNRLPFRDFIQRIERQFPHMEGDFASTITFHSLPKLRYYYRYNTIVFKRKQG